MKINAFDYLDDDIIGVDEKTVIVPTKASAEKIRKEAISIKTAVKRKNTNKRIIMIAAAAVIIASSIIAVLTTSAEQYLTPEEQLRKELSEQRTATITQYTQYIYSLRDSGIKEYLGNSIDNNVNDYTIREIASQKLQEEEETNLIILLQRYGKAQNVKSCRDFITVYNEVTDYPLYCKFMIDCCELYHNSDISLREKIILSEYVEFHRFSLMITNHYIPAYSKEYEQLRFEAYNAMIPLLQDIGCM